MNRKLSLHEQICHPVEVDDHLLGISAFAFHMHIVLVLATQPFHPKKPLTQRRCGRIFPALVRVLET